MVQRLAQWYETLTKWAEGSWWKWALIALPAGLLVVALVSLYAFFDRPRPKGNPDLDEARAAGKAEEKAERQADEINKEAAEQLARSKGMTSEELKKSLLDEVSKP